MASRVVVVGSGGRLGAALARVWRARGVEVVGFDHASLDLADQDALRRTLEPLDFEVLVNCAAQTNVDYCEQHPEEARRLNADAVGVLGEICARKAKRCLHISTDYVFDGSKRSPYLETDFAAPISHYGNSKLAGELALLASSDRHLAVRVSWVFGPDRPSFIDAILKRAIQGDPLEAIDDKIAVPTFSLDAAELLFPFLLEQPLGGVLHLCNSGLCSWQEYGQHAIDCAVAMGRQFQERVVKGVSIQSMQSFSARRPVFSALETGKLTTLVGRAPRAWQDAVEEYVQTYWCT